MNEAKLWFWILLDVLIAVVVVTVVAVGVPALSQFSHSLVSARTLTVTAQGKTTAAPDLAELSFSVVTQGSDPQTLATNNNNKMNSVIQFVEGQGVASSDIQTTGYNLQPNYQYPQNGLQGVISGYTLTQTVQVKVRDLSKTADVVGGLAPLGVNQIGSIDFTFADDTSVLAAARADAMTKAQTEAMQMAKAAGARLGGVVNVTENGNIPAPRPMYSVASGMGGANVAESTPSIQPGSEDITDNVTVTYALY